VGLQKGNKNKNTRESDILPRCRDASSGAIALNFGMPGDIADVITCAKVYVNRFRGFGVLTPPILPFSIGFSWSPLQQREHYRATL